MAQLKGKTLKVKTNDFSNVRKLLLKKDRYTNELLKVEDVYFNKYIASFFPKHYKEKDIKLAKRLYKCVTTRIYNEHNSTINKKEIDLKEFNWVNFKEAIINTVEAVRTYSINKKIVCADISRLPFDNLFYNLKIKTKDTYNKEVLKLFKSIPTYSTGKLKMGYQSGERDSNGNILLTEFEESKAVADKCYFSLNFIENVMIETKEKEETVAIYYYLGNKYMN